MIPAVAATAARASLCSSNPTPPQDSRSRADCGKPGRLARGRLSAALKKPDVAALNHVSWFMLASTLRLKIPAVAATAAGQSFAEDGHGFFATPTPEPRLKIPARSRRLRLRSAKSSISFNSRSLLRLKIHAVAATAANPAPPASRLTEARLMIPAVAATGAIQVDEFDKIRSPPQDSRSRGDCGS